MSLPNAVKGLSNVKQLSTYLSSYGDVCALLFDGSITCFDPYAPDYIQEFPDISNALSIAGNSANGCAILDDKSLKCWGWPTRNADLAESASDVVPTGITDVVDVAVYETYACAVISSGQIKCFGDGPIGTTSSNIAITVIPNIDNATKIIAGSGHACALLADGSVSCWGEGGDGQLQDPIMSASLLPITITGIVGKEISVSGNRTCVRTEEGKIQCWGKNSTFSSDFPPETTIDSGVIASSNSMTTSCAVVDEVSDSKSGKVKCWGNNFFGQLGVGTPLATWNMLSVPGINDAVAVTTSFQSCALHADKSLSCWGNLNWFDDLKIPREPNIHKVSAAAGSKFLAVAAGFLHICALSVDGTVSCWGSNFSGQLGNSNMGFSEEPVLVSGVNKAIGIVAGEEHSCALLEDHSVQCWGTGADGTAESDGYPAAANVHLVKKNGVVLKDVQRLTAGANMTCAIMTNGSVQCWGWDDCNNWNVDMVPECTSNYYGRFVEPQTITGIANATAISMAYKSACTIVNGSVLCWGSNTPAAVPGVSQAIDVTVNCATLSDGSLTCWGDNYYGRLGRAPVGAEFALRTLPLL